MNRGGGWSVKLPIQTEGIGLCPLSDTDMSFGLPQYRIWQYDRPFISWSAPRLSAELWQNDLTFTPEEQKDKVMSSFHKFPSSYCCLDLRSDMRWNLMYLYLTCLIALSVDVSRVSIKYFIIYIHACCYRARMGNLFCPIIFQEFWQLWGRRLIVCWFQRHFMAILRVGLTYKMSQCPPCPSWVLDIIFSLVKIVKVIFS